jgi:hypothetical protein
MSDTLYAYIKTISESSELLAVRVARVYRRLSEEGCVSFTLKGSHDSVALLLDSIADCREPLLSQHSPAMTLQINDRLKNERCLIGKTS